MSGNSVNRLKLSRRELLVAGAAISSASILPVSAKSSAKSRQSYARDSFDLDRFVEDCVAANRESDPQGAVGEVLRRAVDSPSSVLAALGEANKAGIRVLYRSTTLTMFSATWTPQMNLLPHNHLMWALIGIYTGREDNIFWRRTPDRIEAFGAEALFTGGVGVLPADVIHSVTNPLLRFTGGIHIYGGDFFNTERSEWNPETLSESPSGGESIRAMFKRENERYRISNCSVDAP